MDLTTALGPAKNIGGVKETPMSSIMSSAVVTVADSKMGKSIDSTLCRLNNKCLLPETCGAKVDALPRKFVLEQEKCLCLAGEMHNQLNSSG